MMHRFNLALSIISGTAIAIGLTVVIGLHALPAEARPALSLAAPAIDHDDVISDALGYLRTQQQPDGGIDAFDTDTSSDGGTARALLALVATGRPASWMTHTTTGKMMTDYLADRAITFTHDISGTTSDHLFPQNAGLLLAAVAAADEDPGNFGGMDLITELNNTYHPATGAYSTTARGAFISGKADSLNQAWAILGLSSAGQQVLITATDFLIGLQNADGGWGDDFFSGGSDLDTTAYAVLALVGSGNVQPTDAAIQKALDLFHTTQLPSGGWRPGWDIDPANADTTGWVIQALGAAGYTPATESWAASPNPHEALLSLQKADGRIGGTWANAQSTAEAILGLTEQPVFFLGRTHRALRALTWMGELQSVDGSWPTPFGHPAGPTCDAVLAYAAAGFDPYTVKAPGSVTSAMDYLSSTAFAFADISADSAGKLALAVEVASGDAHDLGGVDVVRVLTTTWYSPTLGAFGVPTNTWHQAWAVLGLAAADEEIPISTTKTLTDLQQADGGWKYDLGPWSSGSDPDSTGLALQALVAAGVPTTDTTIVSGVLSLRNEQNAQGSWDAFGSPSVNSTAYAMQGLLAAGENLVADEWLKNGHSSYNALADLQKIDGPFTLGANDDFFSTRQAVPALLGVPYPFSHTLTLFVGVGRGPDPDRLVTVSPRATWGDSVDVVIPFGSDLDADGSVTLDWHVSGATSWVTDAMVHRADGYYTATLPVTRPVAYEFRVTLTDPDSVQCGGELTGTVTLTATLEPYCASLPLVLKE